MAQLAIRTSCRSADSGWDEFVEASEGGHHAQTSMWGEVKAATGWQPIRVIVEDGGEIVAGCQMLTQRFARIGRVSFVARGPVVPRDRTDLLDLLLDGLAQIAGDGLITYLLLHPAEGRQDLVELLRARKFLPSVLEGAPSTTVRIDLRRSEAELLAAMSSTTAKHVRQAARRGVTLREGDLRDLPAYYELVRRSAARIGYRPPPVAHFERIISEFGCGNRAAFVLAELDGRLVSGLLSIGFAESLVAKTIGWTGTDSDRRPNEAVYWRSIQWAQERGYRWFDFDGFDPAGSASPSGDQPPVDRTALQGAARFKLGFGGELARFPGAVDYSYQPGVVRGVRLVAPHRRSVKKLRLKAGSLLRTGATPPSKGAVA